MEQKKLGLEQPDVNDCPTVTKDTPNQIIQHICLCKKNNWSDQFKIQKIFCRTSVCSYGTQLVTLTSCTIGNKAQTNRPTCHGQWCWYIRTTSFKTLTQILIIRSKETLK